jgi:hypothetical protein
VTALTLVALLGVALVLIWAGQRRLMYFPERRVSTPEALGLANVEEVVFPTPDGLDLHGWFVPARDPRATVLVFNGNAGNRAHRAPLAIALQRRGLNVLLMDYRGYGENGGSPSEEGLAADGRAARTYLTSRPDVDASRLVYFGESLGTGVAVRLASEHPPAVLVLRSPFTSMADVGRFHYPFLPVGSLLQDRFPSLDRIDGIQSPLLVVAGDRDRIIPPEQSRRLYEAATGQKDLVVVPGADHNDYELLAGEPLIQAVVAFIERHVPARTAPDDSPGPVVG